MINNYLYLSGAILSTAFGQFTYKKYAISSNKIYYWQTIVLFLLVPILSFKALQFFTIDVVYMSTSLTILIVLFLSKYFLHETIDQQSYWGIFYIILGVIIYAT